MTAAGPQEFVEDLWPALRQATAIARALEGRVANRPKAGEATDVKAALTMADTAAQEALLVPLLDRFGDVRLAAEEDTPSVKRFTGRRQALVVVDPIDGTLRSYLRGEGPYASMAGLALGGRYRAAVVALPREGLILAATEGGGARVGAVDGEPGPARAHADGDTLLVSYDLPEPVEARLVEGGYRLSPACGGAIAVAPLLPGVCGGLRLPAGTDGLSIRGRIGVLVSREAGARVGPGAEAWPEVLDAPMRALAVAADEAVRADLEAAVAAAPHMRS